GDQGLLLVLVGPLVGGHQTAGADRADLVVQEFPVAALAVPETVPVGCGRLRQLLGEPLVQGLAPTAFGRRHAGGFHGPGPLGRGPAAVEGVVDTVVVQGVLGIEQSGVVLNVGRVRLVDVVSPSVGAVHGYLQGVGTGRPRSRRGPHRTALVRDTGATRPRPPGTRVFPEPVPDSSLPPRFGTAQRHGTPPPPARPAPAGSGTDHRPRQAAAGPGPRGRGAKGVRPSPGAAPPPEGATPP